MAEWFCGLCSCGYPCSYLCSIRGTVHVGDSENWLRFRARAPFHCTGSRLNANLVWKLVNEAVPDINPYETMVDDAKYEHLPSSISKHLSAIAPVDCGMLFIWRYFLKRLEWPGLIGAPVVATELCLRKRSWSPDALICCIRVS